MTFWLRFAAFFVVFCMVAAVFSVPNFQGAPKPTDAAEAAIPITVILDAGHGGEDGGAVSASGIFEKDLNLAVTLKLRDLLTASGVHVVLTRSEDVLLYDRNVDFHGRKKALDLAARRKIAEETPNAVFVSIHMNAFPQTQYKGLQIWYSQNHPASLLLAETIQKMATDQLQPKNHRRAKAATSSIYLLHKLNCPAVLVECGFLSNSEEAALLSTEDYQNRLALLLFLSIIRGIEKIPPEFSKGS